MAIETKRGTDGREWPGASVGMAEMEGSEAGLIPLEVIRTENVISKFPVHNLAKTGRVNIKINRRRADGEVEFQWEVSYNEKYGEAKQLAYQLDTLIISKRIYEYFEANEPIPEVVPIGSLYQICQELGMNPQSGKNKNNIKHALGQNAGAFIDARISFKDRDGEERKLAAQFTRYSVVHRDQKLPDGRRADQVYVVLQPIYLEVLNSARWRPLDFAYLRELPPASQRCYEIISTRIFAALKYGHSRAELSYSDYCAFSAQMRHARYKPFRAQMDHVHKPHLASGYLASVEFEETSDGDGQIDWLIRYYPGPRAKAEFAYFNPRYGEVAISEGRADAAAREGQGSDARELVVYFYQLVHGAGPDYEPGRKELEQAGRLIRQYGVEAARYVVGYAQREAPKTKFEMQVFGAVLIYEKRAIGAYGKWKADRGGAGGKKEREEGAISELEALSLARQRYELLPEAEKAERARRARASLEAGLKANEKVNAEEWSEEFRAEMIREAIVWEIADAIRYGSPE
ncbi:MAG: hypothetical protein ACKVX9_06650 [Blastocatellia bacterium]